jgi:hypothetical protein
MPSQLIDQDWTWSTNKGYDHAKKCILITWKWERNKAL